jgi:hypothetical protein
VEVLCLSLVKYPPDAKEFYVMCPKFQKQVLSMSSLFFKWIYSMQQKNDLVVKIAEKNKESIKKTIMVLTSNI